MTTAQLKEAIGEATDVILAALKNHDKETRTSLVLIEKAVSGEEPDAIPWHSRRSRMSREKRAQVDAVYEYMQDKRIPKSERTVSNACRQQFAYCKSGFHSYEQLKSYCYRPHVRDFLESCL